MSWLYLVLAGVFEIGWPLGLKISQLPQKMAPGLSLAALSMAASGYLLWLAQKEIPLGTAYAIWTGIGAAGTFFVGVWYFGDAASLGRYLGVLFIISGVVLLRISH